MPHGIAPVPLSEVLDRLLAIGVVIVGDATISVAGVDLVYLGLQTVLTSTATLKERRVRKCGRA